MMLKGFMACTGCLPAGSMSSSTHKSGHFWSNLLLMLTVLQRRFSFDDSSMKA